MTAVAPQAKPAAAPTAPPPPKVRGESDYDRVTSLLMAVVLGAVMVFGWPTIVYATTRAYAARAARSSSVVSITSRYSPGAQAESGVNCQRVS